MMGRFFFLIFIGVTGMAQTAIGGLPQESAVLNLEATNKALLLTRVADVSQIASPVNGMIAYDISKKCIRVFENGSWSNCIDVETAKVSGIDCSGTTNFGSLKQGNSADNVYTVIPYNNGNGGIFKGYSINSTGIAGLTGSISGFQLANGSGSLIMRITGTPLASGTAQFSIAIGGQSCTVLRSVL